MWSSTKRGFEGGQHQKKINCLIRKEGEKKSIDRIQVCTIFSRAPGCLARSNLFCEKRRKKAKHSFRGGGNRRPGATFPLIFPELGMRVFPRKGGSGRKNIGTRSECVCGGGSSIVELPVHVDGCPFPLLCRQHRRPSIIFSRPRPFFVFISMDVAVLWIFLIFFHLQNSFMDGVLRCRLGWCFYFFPVVHVRL